MNERTEPTWPADLASLIDYQPGAIVSRVLMKNPAGNVTLFAFDAGEALSEHTAPFDAMVQIVEGNATVSLASKPFALTQGQAIMLPAHKPHAVEATKRFKMLLVMLRGESEGSG